MTNSTLNQNLTQEENKYLQSVYLLEMCRIINLFITLLFIILGLIGHIITIFVFAQDRFRKNSSNVYLLCLAINDAFYLIAHFFEDTVKTYRDIFSNEEHSFANLINLIDKYDFACKLLNYFRYVLRFVSAYTIIAFTTQRLSLVYSPFSNKFKTKRSAWLTFLTILCFSLVVNLWVPFLFKLRDDEHLRYCDVSADWSREYFHITLAYICFIMLFPIVIITVSNSIIISNIVRADSNRNKMCSLDPNMNETNNRFYGSFFSMTTFNRSRASSRQSMPGRNKFSSFRLQDLTQLKTEVQRPYYLNISQLIGRISRQSNNSIKLTRLLVFISFSYSLFNLPYLIAWFVFYYEMILNMDNKHELAKHNYFYSVLKVVEIFYLLNYGINFYIYCASGSIFRQQLKYSSIIFKFFVFYCLKVIQLITFLKLIRLGLISTRLSIIRSMLKITRKVFN